jgi:hypothetical protein
MVAVLWLEHGGASLYEYIIRRTNNESKMEELINAAAEDGWEPVTYAVRPSGGIFVFLFGWLSGDHLVLLRRTRA